MSRGYDEICRYNRSEWVCLCIMWSSNVNIQYLPQSLHTLFFKTGSLTDWLARLSLQWASGTSLSLPSQSWYYSTGIHAMAPVLTWTLGNPIQVTELSQQVLNRRDDLPSPSLSFKRPLVDKCALKPFFSRGSSLLISSSPLITAYKGPISVHNKERVSFHSKFKFVFLYDSLPYNHPSNENMHPTSNKKVFLNSFNFCS